MPKINDLTSLKANAKALDAELRAVLEKYGLKMEGRSARIGDGECSFKIRTTYLSDEEKADREEQEFRAYAPIYGVPADTFGKKYRFPNGVIVAVAGIQPNKPKNRIKLKDVHTGKGYQCSVEALKSAKEVA